MSTSSESARTRWGRWTWRHHPIRLEHDNGWECTSSASIEKVVHRARALARMLEARHGAVCVLEASS